MVTTRTSSPGARRQWKDRAKGEGVGTDELLSRRALLQRAGALTTFAVGGRLLASRARSDAAPSAGAVSPPPSPIKSSCSSHAPGRPRPVALVYRGPAS